MSKKKIKSQKDTGDKNATDKPDSRRAKIEPNPPKPNVVVLVTSGILMVGWMIFLLFIAIS